MNDVATEYPTTFVELSGHSRRAEVIAQMFTYSYGALSPRARSNYVAAVLRGDPWNHSGERIDASGNGQSNGFFSGHRPKSSLDKYKSYDFGAQRFDQSIL